MTFFDDSDIVSGALPGGANTSHTVAILHLGALLDAVPAGAGRRAYEEAAVERNLLGRATYAGRKRTFRYLRELYLLDPGRILFRALRDLWDEDPEARAQLAGICALARDSSFRATAPYLLGVARGARVTADDLARSVSTTFPGTYNADTASKIGRNTASSWTQTGHLAGRSIKTRRLVEPRPASIAYAMLLGCLEGRRGQGLYDTLWTRFLDAEPRVVELAAERASLRGYLDLRSAGGVVEIGFRHLLRPLEGESA